MNLSSIYKDRIATLTPLYEGVKKVNEFKSDHLSSKMWILPNGTIKPLDMWHYQYILRNRDEAERFGVDLDSLPHLDEYNVRIAALKAGFFRINHVSRDQSLTIEGIKDKFNKRIKDALFMLIFKNIGSIGAINIQMFDPAVSSVVYSKYVPHGDDKTKLEQLEDLLF